ncbi:MAG: META domain-containing protein [Thermohalobaculum sp.]|nr:META domain-containing protein [Thermohalobaculum sp.]
MAWCGQGLAGMALAVLAALGIAGGAAESRAQTPPPDSGAAAPRPGETRPVAGTLSYRARIALPPDALAVVEARDADGALLAEARVDTARRQVPIPFALDVPAGADVSLRAAIFDGAVPLWLGGPVAVAAADGAAGAVALSPFPAAGFRQALRCGASELALEIGPDGAAITRGAERVALAPVPAASGARFEAPGDPTTFLWSKGAEAMVSLKGEALPPCAVAVPQPEAPFRARGNEPGWNLSIAEGRITLVTDFGATRREADLPAATREEGARVLRLADPAAVVRIEDRLCRDDATGMPHPAVVTVETDGRLLRGCGGEPAALLAGPDWVVEDIAGGGVIDASGVTLGFAEGQVWGSGGCNRYSGGFSLTGESLGIGPLAATMMACEPALMTQERRLFKALADATGFDIDPTGALVLKAADGAVLVRARRG